MEFMVLRRANQSTERGIQPPALEPGTFLQPSTHALRLLRRAGVWSQVAGPFPPRELVAGLVLLDAGSRQDIVEQVRWWPLFDSGAVYEIRAASMGGVEPGGMAQRQPQLTRYVVFLRSDSGMEQDLALAPEAVGPMHAYHEAGVRQGLLLAAEAMQGSGSAVRVHYANDATSRVDGPYAELKDLVAGYWMLQADSMEAVLAWFMSYPFAQPAEADITLEIRGTCESVARVEFTPEMQAAEQRLRAELLEARLRNAFSKAARGG
jgi:hypothetical protein